MKPPLPAVGGNEGVGRIEEVVYTLSFPISIPYPSRLDRMSYPSRRVILLFLLVLDWEHGERWEITLLIMYGQLIIDSLSRLEQHSRYLHLIIITSTSVSVG